MLSRRAILTALIAGATTGSVRATDRGIAVYAWKNRLLLLFADRADDPELRRQQAILAADPAGQTERQIVVISVIGAAVRVAGGRDSGLVAAMVRRDVGVAAGFAVVLVGKDTGIKLRRRAPVDLDRLYSTIDAMPMRRRERREQTD